jgi:hypothetical protein
MAGKFCKVKVGKFMDLHPLYCFLIAEAANSLCLIKTKQPRGYASELSVILR